MSILTITKKRSKVINWINRSKLFHPEIFIRQAIFKRIFSKTVSFLQSIIDPQVFKKVLPKMIGQVLLATELSTRKSAGYLILPQRTFTSLTIPIGQMVSLLAKKQSASNKDNKQLQQVAQSFLSKGQACGNTYKDQTFS